MKRLITTILCALMLLSTAKLAAQEAESDVITGGKNHVTFNFLNFLSGDYSIYYERVLNEKFGVEAGVGFTYRNFLLDLGYVFRQDNDGNNFADYSIRDASIGYAISLTPKFYPSTDEYGQGLYLGPMFRYRSYTWNFYECDAPNSFDAATFPERENHFDFAMLLGVKGGGESFIVDFFAGFGIRSASGTRYYHNYESGVCVETPTKIKRTTPLFVTGLKMGGIF